MGSMKASSQILLSRPKAGERIVGGGSSYTDCMQDGAYFFLTRSYMCL